MAQQLSSQMKCTFVITGSEDELPLAKKLAAHITTPVLNAMGRVSIRQLGALLSRCNLYITNDTGPMHIAALVKTPLVAIFGPGSLVRFDPRNISKKAIVLRKETKCAPCNKWECKALECLRKIAPHEVSEAALFLLRGNASHGQEKS